MTLGEGIRRVDALRPNAATEEEKARWILELERELETVFLPQYDGPRPQGARRWPEDRAAALLGSGPFEEMYVYRALARCELMDREWDAYNAHAAVAQQLESGFKKQWERTHRRKSGGGVTL